MRSITRSVGTSYGDSCNRAAGNGGVRCEYVCRICLAKFRWHAGRRGHRHRLAVGSRPVLDAAAVRGERAGVPVVGGRVLRRRATVLRQRRPSRRPCRRQWCRVGSSRCGSSRKLARGRFGLGSAGRSGRFAELVQRSATSRERRDQKAQAPAIAGSRVHCSSLNNLENLKSKHRLYTAFGIWFLKFRFRCNRIGRRYVRRTCKRSE